jgi:DNA-binding NarL/FixJ family response regulator
MVLAVNHVSEFSWSTIYIGLPKLDGIEAARHIRKLAPESKILFLSQELDPVVARAALSAGGHGYVIKSDAYSELFTAVEAVMLGKGFVSPRLRDHGCKISIAQKGIAVEAPVHRENYLRKRSKRPG